MQSIPAEDIDAKGLDGKQKVILGTYTLNDRENNEDIDDTVFIMSKP